MQIRLDDASFLHGLNVVLGIALAVLDPGNLNDGYNEHSHAEDEVADADEMEDPPPLGVPLIKPREEISSH